MIYKYIEIKNKDNKIIRGVHNLPENTGKGKGLPTVIIVHGFTGNKLGNNFFFVRMSKYFTENGYGTFRFDFTGSGESDGEFEDMSLTSELNDMDSIINYVKTNLNVNKDKIYIIGHSMGGLITTLKAEDYKPKKIILLAPANDMHKTITERVYGSFIQNKEEVNYKGLKIKKEFISDLEKYKPYGKAKLYKGDVLIFRGSEDTAVSKETCVKTESTFPGTVEYYELDGVDHSFTNYNIRQYIMKKIKNFIEQDN